eukprot:Cvel_7530.t1-p1 / transcript=Cvel_7530.t1 / gene=Cvel_7530 / organism=Chromera_velia_CCMP2878 / gene_product=ATP-binding cassette sub-family F member 1, putative / transcript_product=ATP-binding cassette sub-family F member 1, putative / location=Cvel_scaffold396:3480-12802(+) / protein_length=1422 / sequence_SO=supercontig / SO=protein_coding / is_pseudo=false
MSIDFLEGSRVVSYNGSQLVLDVGLQRGGTELFGVSRVSLQHGSVSAIVAPNGFGKTSFLSSLMNLSGFPDLSVAVIRSDWVRLETESADGPGTQPIGSLLPVDFLLHTLRQRQQSLQQQISDLEDNLPTLAADAVEKAAERIGFLYDALDSLDDAQIQEVAMKALSELGFVERGVDSTKCGELSGGWLYRLKLASTLLARPEILIIDEPSFLDEKGTDWLIHFLSEELTEGNNSIVLLATHKEYLLEALAEQILYITPGTETEGRMLLQFSGSYDSFLHTQQQVMTQKQKGEKAVAIEEATAAKTKQLLQKEQKKKDAGFAKKTEVGGSRALRQTTMVSEQKAHSALKNRAKHLERVRQRIESRGEAQGMNLQKQQALAPIRLTGEAAAETGAPILLVDSVDFSYETIRNRSSSLLQQLSCAIYPKDCIALVGENGAGKSTLLKLIVGELSPSRGEVRFPHPLRYVYFPQNAAMELTLRDDIGGVTAQDLVQRVASTEIQVAGRTGKAPVTMSQLQARSHLGQFGLTKELAERKVGSLSTGERTRLYLSLLMIGFDKNLPPQLLILDEISDNLDVDTVDSLVAALEGFEGAVLAVSHERVHFLERMQTRLHVVKGHFELDADPSLRETAGALAVHVIAKLEDSVGKTSDQPSGSSQWNEVLNLESKGAEDPTGESPLIITLTAVCKNPISDPQSAAGGSASTGPGGESEWILAQSELKISDTTGQQTVVFTRQDGQKAGEVEVEFVVASAGELQRFRELADEADRENPIEPNGDEGEPAGEAQQGPLRTGASVHFEDESPSRHAGAQDEEGARGSSTRVVPPVATSTVPRAQSESQLAQLTRGMTGTGTGRSHAATDGPPPLTPGPHLDEMLARVWDSPRFHHTCCLKGISFGELQPRKPSDFKNFRKGPKPIGLAMSLPEVPKMMADNYEKLRRQKVFECLDFYNRVCGSNPREKENPQRQLTEESEAPPAPPQLGSSALSSKAAAPLRQVTRTFEQFPNLMTKAKSAELLSNLMEQEARRIEKELQFEARLQAAVERENEEQLLKELWLQQRLVYRHKRKEEREKMYTEKGKFALDISLARNERFQTCKRARAVEREERQAMRTVALEEKERALEQFYLEKSMKESKKGEEWLLKRREVEARIEADILVRSQKAAESSAEYERKVEALKGLLAQKEKERLLNVAEKEMKWVGAADRVERRKRQNEYEREIQAEKLQEKFDYVEAMESVKQMLTDQRRNRNIMAEGLKCKPLSLQRVQPGPGSYCGLQHQSCIGEFSAPKISKASVPNVFDQAWMSKRDVPAPNVYFRSKFYKNDPEVMQKDITGQPSSGSFGLHYAQMLSKGGNTWGGAKYTVERQPRATQARRDLTGYSVPGPGNYFLKKHPARVMEAATKPAEKPTEASPSVIPARIVPDYYGKGRF